MDDAPLDLRLREHSLDGIPEARQAVHTEKQDILYAPVLQVIQHSQPELEDSFAPTVMLRMSL